MYAYTLQVWLGGKSPYEFPYAPGFEFVYPPIFLYVAGWLARLLPGAIGWSVYLTLQMGSTLALPLILSAWIYRQRWLTFPMALLIFFSEATFSGLAALGSGNIAAPCYCAIFLGMLPGVRNNRWRWLYLAIFLTSLIKINFLVFLLMPIFLGKRQLGKSLFSGAWIAAAYLAQQRFLPDLFQGYRQSVHQTFVEGHAYGRGILGFTINAAAKLHVQHGLLPYFFMGLVIVMTVSSLFVLQAKLPEDHRGSVWAALVLVAILICNPRLFAYDVDYAMPAVLILLMHGLKMKRPLLLTSSTVLISAAFVLIDRRHLATGFETLLFIFSFAVMYVRLWKEAKAAHSLQSQFV